jgi:hypothetical protein
MGPKIQWLQSFVTDDKIYCIYIAPDEEAVKQHAVKGGFPANVVARVRSVIDPVSAEHYGRYLMPACMNDCMNWR